MPVNRWKYKLSVADVFHNEDMTFEEIRDVVVRRIRGSAWFKGCVKQSMFSELEDAVEELADTESTEEFDAVWGFIYDIADADRCWIATF